MSKLEKAFEDFGNASVGKQVGISFLLTCFVGLTILLVKLGTIIISAGLVLPVLKLLAVVCFVYGGVIGLIWGIDWWNKQ